MASMDEQVLRTAKEIVVKFIEAGRISPGGFHDAFNSIYQTISDAVAEEADRGNSEETSGSQK
jgi:hypothetical protein